MSETATETKPLVHQGEDGWVVPSPDEIAKFTTLKCGQMMDELLKGELITTAPTNFSKMGISDKREELIKIVKVLSGEPVAEEKNDKDTEKGGQVDLEDAIKAQDEATVAANAKVDAKVEIPKTEAQKTEDALGGKVESKATVKPKKGKGVVSENDPIVQFAHKVENMKERSDLEDLIRRLLSEDSENEFKLGGAIARVQELQIWKDAGYESLKDYIETALGLSYRKAMYSVEIYSKLLSLDASWDDFKNIGWSKVSSLLPVLSKDSIVEWVEKAQSMNTESLKKAVKDALEPSKDGNKPEADPKAVKTKAFKLHKDQLEIVEAAVEKAKKDGNTEYDAPALEYICQSYMGTSTAFPTLDAAMIATRKKSGSPEEFAQTVIEILEKLTPELVINVDISPAKKADAA